MNRTLCLATFLIASTGCGTFVRNPKSGNKGDNGTDEKRMQVVGTVGSEGGAFGLSGGDNFNVAGPVGIEIIVESLSTDEAGKRHFQKLATLKTKAGRFSYALPAETVVRFRISGGAQGAPRLLTLPRLSNEFVGTSAEAGKVLVLPRIDERTDASSRLVGHLHERGLAEVASAGFDYLTAAKIGAARAGALPDAKSDAKKLSILASGLTAVTKARALRLDGKQIDFSPLNSLLAGRLVDAARAGEDAPEFSFLLSRAEVEGDVSFKDDLDGEVLSETDERVLSEVEDDDPDLARELRREAIHSQVEVALVSGLRLEALSGGLGEGEGAWIGALTEASLDALASHAAEESLARKNFGGSAAPIATFAQKVVAGAKGNTTLERSRMALASAFASWMKATTPAVRETAAALLMKTEEGMAVLTRTELDVMTACLLEGRFPGLEEVQVGMEAEGGAPGASGRKVTCAAATLSRKRDAD